MPLQTACLPCKLVGAPRISRWPSAHRGPDVYYLGFPRDKGFIKSLVAAWLIIETAQTILVMYDIFQAYAMHFGSMAFLDKAQTSWLGVPIITGIGEYSNTLPVAKY